MGEYLTYTYYSVHHFMRFTMHHLIIKPLSHDFEQLTITLRHKCSYKNREF